MKTEMNWNNKKKTIKWIRNIILFIEINNNQIIIFIKIPKQYFNQHTTIDPINSK